MRFATKAQRGLGQRTVLLVQHLQCDYCVAFSADGRRAYSAGGGTIRDSAKDGTDFAVRVWDLESGEQLRPLEGHKGKIRSVAVSPDGRYVLTGGHDAATILWDARTGHEIHRFRGHTEKVRCVAFLPDGRPRISAGEDRTIHLWDVESGREVLGYFKEPTGFIGQFAVSPDGRRLFSADTGGSELRYWNLETGTLIQKLDWEANPTSGSFTTDGRHVVWGGFDGILRMYRLNDIPVWPIAPPRQSPNPARRSG